MPGRFRVLNLPLLAAALAAGLYAGEPSGVDAGQVLDSYLLASRTQRQRLNGSTAEVSFEAEIPKLHKMGRLSALRRVSRLGRLTYDILRYEGDNSVKNNVIARYLSAEVQVRESSDDSLSIIPQNYKFSYRGTRHFEGRRVYAFDVKPRAKRKGLFKGSIWIDAEDYLLVRETGRFVRNPSVFIKKVQFTRDYQHKDGLAVVTRLETTVETRVVGPAHMTVNYADYRFEPSFVNVGLIQTDSQ